MKNNFIEYLHKYSSGGKSSPIHIKKENEGKFTQSAKEYGMGVLEYAQSVLNDPNASALQKKRANFARNAKVWKHRDGSVMHTFTNPYQEEYSAESYEPTYDMGELAPVYVTAKATPEERNKAQLRANELWRQYQENYAEYLKAKNAAELAQLQHDFNAHIRKGMNEAGETVSAFFPIPGIAGLGITRKLIPAAKQAVRYVAPVAKRATETISKFTPKSIKNLGKSLKTPAKFNLSSATTTKDLVGDAVNTGTTAKQETTALSLEEILKAFEAARQWHLNRINSPGYTNRALRAGFTEEEIPLLQLQLTSLINRLKLFNPEGLFKKVNMKHNYNGKASAGYWKIVNNEGKLLLGIRFDNPNMSYDDAVSTFVHEFGHGATFGLNGNETTGYMKLLSDLFPLLTRVVKYNKTLYPEVNENIVTQVMPKVGNNAGYYADPSEMLSRGYEFMRDYANNFFKLKNSEGLTTQNVIDNAANTRINSKIFRALTGNLGAFNFQKKALGITAPLGLGGYGLYRNNNLLQQSQYYKQGGKINPIKYSNKIKY